MAPARSPWDIEQRLLAEEWTRITNGLVTVTFFNMNSLGGEKSVIQKFRSVRAGAKAPLDGAIFTTIGLNELAPDARLFTLSIPFLITSQKDLDAALSEVGPSLISKYKAAGFEMIAWSNVGWLSFFTKKEFATLRDLKRIKIASAGIDSPVLGNSFRAAGFTIEDILSAKLLQSMKSSSGVNGFFSVHLYAYVTGLSKTINYTLDAKLCPVMAGFVISNESWARIPERYRPAMLAAANRMRAQLDQSLESSDRKYLDLMKAEGVTLVTLSPGELEKWKAEFERDLESINRSVPGAFDMEMYTKIRKLLKGR
ncbi:MAG TPA: TRAP transporter substrate-binding protein DctP [Treponemataceae bacterium]|nr:TRAP transporter substrate-binding protein DctP [Treponemataceae bacterium]